MDLWRMFFCSYHWNMFFCSMENCCCSIVSIESFLFHGVSFGGTMASAIYLFSKRKTMILHIIVVMTWYHISTKAKIIQSSHEHNKMLQYVFQNDALWCGPNPFISSSHHLRNQLINPKICIQKRPRTPTPSTPLKRGVDLQLDGLNLPKDGKPHLGNLSFFLHPGSPSWPNICKMARFLESLILHWWVRNSVALDFQGKSNIYSPKNQDGYLK